MNQNRSRDQTLRVLSQQRVICNRNTAKKIAELRENARCIFWSGALAFHGPKITFLHDKHEELLVEKSSFILCTFVYPRCYGRLKYGKIQRTNGIQNIMYFTRVVQTKESLVGEEKQGLLEQIKKKLNFCFCRWILENY